MGRAWNRVKKNGKMRVKPNYINNHIKCKWSKHPNEKAEIVKWDFTKCKTHLYAAYKKSTLNTKTQFKSKRM